IGLRRNCVFSPEPTLVLLACCAEVTVFPLSCAASVLRPQVQVCVIKCAERKNSPVQTRRAMPAEKYTSGNLPDASPVARLCHRGIWCLNALGQYRRILFVTAGNGAECNPPVKSPGA